MSNQDVKIRTRYSAVAPVLVDGDWASPRSDSDGVLLVRTSGGGSTAALRYNSAGDIASAVIKASSAVLYQIVARNGNAATRYLHIFNSATVPANGAVPNWIPLDIPTLQPVSFYFGDNGLTFATGLSIALSSTRTTLTLAAADMWASAVYL